MQEFKTIRGSIVKFDNNCSSTVLRSYQNLQKIYDTIRNYQLIILMIEI